MNVKRLKTFILVVEYRSFSAVAQVLQISQPAVTKQIQTLEKELGVTLLHRNTLEPTEAGRHVLHKANQFLQQWDELVVACKRFQGTLSGQLSIGASTIPGTYLIPAFLREYIDLYPGMEVKLSVHESDEVLDLLKDEKLDIGFVGCKPQDALFYDQLLAKDRLQIIAPYGNEKIKHFDEIQEKPFIFRSDRSGTWQAAKQGLKKWGHSVEELHCVAMVQNTESIISMVEAGLGYSIVSELAAKPATESARISIIGELPVERAFYTVCLQTKAQSPSVASLLEFLAQGNKEA